MQLAASDFYTYLNPHKCDRRLYLRHTGEPEEPATPYQEVLKRLGERHERAHLATLPEFVDLSALSRKERLARTREEVERAAPAIYQPALEADLFTGGTDCHVIGDPDFLIRSNGGYVIRDSKMSRRITEEDHPEVLRQLNTYGWLYEQTFGTAPKALQVHNGTGDIVEVVYDATTILPEFDTLSEIKNCAKEPYAPVGWSKCTGCPFNSHCWNEAVAKKSPALVPGVDQGLARQLHLDGIDTIERLLANFTEETLSDLKRPWGTRMQRVGKAAGRILIMARAMASGREEIMQAPKIPNVRNYVIFDLEGMPPQLKELDKVYLWGMQVYGAKPSSFMPALASFGPAGEKEGWEEFLRLANTIFAEHGDIPFVHWANYEKTHVSACMKRYGDPNGVGARVLANLIDLLPITQDAIALPLPSYSLKVVEKYIGFERTLEEYGGNWSMAKFIEATEIEDEQERAKVMDLILKYNEEDLGATWAVLSWLKSIRLN